MSNQTPFDVIRYRYLSWVGYVLASLLVIVPLIDQAMNWGSIQPGSAAWRFGAVGSLGQVTLLPVTGMFLLVAIAHAFGHGAVQKTLEVLGIVVAVLMLGVIGLFLLDAVQMRTVVSGGLTRFDMVAGRALLGLLLILLFSAALPFASMRARRQSRRGKRAAETDQRNEAAADQTSLIRPAI